MSSSAQFSNSFLAAVQERSTQRNINIFVKTFYIKKPAITNFIWSVWWKQCRLDNRHLYRRIVDHETSAIGRHFNETHGNGNPCSGKVWLSCQQRMMLKKEFNSNWITKADSIRAKCLINIPIFSVINVKSMYCMFKLISTSDLYDLATAKHCRFYICSVFLVRFLEIFFYSYTKCLHWL